MLRLTEENAKAWLRARGLPVPRGEAAATAADAGRIATDLGGSVVVKALVPTGRRGKAGAVIVAHSSRDAAAAAKRLIGSTVEGYVVERVYVEEKADIADELYLGFAFGTMAPKIVVSRKGGVDIEETAASDPGAVFTLDIDPLRGLRPWDAIHLWERAGLSGAALSKVARVTSQLAQAFRAADAMVLEINPLAIDGAGEAIAVGTLMGIDENALFRHPEWADAALQDASGRRSSAREQRVIQANRTLPGGGVRYQELDGDIGLLVGGGGAGLLQHDLMLAHGGRPANHTDSSPGPITEKLKVILGCIFDNPNVNGLLIGYNIQQMSRCDLKMEALAHVLREKKIDPRRFPIVVRLVGPEEARARAIAAEFPGIHYLSDDASLEDAVRRIVALTARTQAKVAHS